MTPEAFYGVAHASCCCAASAAAAPREAFARAARANAIVAATPASFEAWLREELGVCATPAASRALDLGSHLDAIARELSPRVQSVR